MWIEPEKALWKPGTRQEISLAWKQVERLLSDPLFNRSRRFSSLLHFIVEHTLNGDNDSLKERILGIKVFGRKPDYDSARDPIVRVTVAELRKRLLCYYEEPQHAEELRILLPVGSYVPQFAPPADWQAQPDDTVELLHASAEEQKDTVVETQAFPTGNQPPVLSNFRKYPIAWIAVVLLMALAIPASLRFFYAPDALQAFWKPVMDAQGAILICIADQPVHGEGLMDASDPLAATPRSGAIYVTDSTNSLQLVELTRMLETRNRSYKVQAQSATSFTDIKTSPLILIGAYNNYWTLRLTAPLRFHFANDPQIDTLWIEDRQNPTRRDWVLPARRYLRTGRDYAIIARFVSPNTGHITYVAAGLGHPSTVLAVKLLLSSDFFKEVERRAPRGWRDHNLEVVYETDAIDGVAGLYRIDAIHSW
jgi:hypothetical protein